MLPYLEHPAFYNQPIWLSEEQKKSPLDVLISFFEDYQLADLRAFLAEVAETCLTTDESSFDDGHKRSELLYNLQKIEQLLDGAYLVARQNQQKDPDTMQGNLSVA